MVRTLNISVLDQRAQNSIANYRHSVVLYVSRTYSLKIYIYLFLTVLGLPCCVGFFSPLVAASRGSSLVAVHGLLTAAASLVAKHGL